MLRSVKPVFLFVVAAVFVLSLPAAAAPALTSISPTSGYPGTQVTINGTGFGATQGSGSVWLGSKLAGSIISWGNTQVVAVVASGAASGSAQVQQGGTWSNSIAFTVIKPNITSISPASGYPGNQVTINGTNFGAAQGSGSVWLGNKLAGSIVSWSNTQIVAVVAATALSGSVQVQQNTVWGNSVAFTVITPNITSISPASGYPGNQVTINGTDFGATQGTGSVWLGNKLAGSIVSWSNTQIVATVAATAASGNAFVQQAGVWSNSIAFTVITPSLTSITPTSGVAGTQITLNGTSFGATQGTGSVWLGSKLAGSIVSWSNTQIVATIASGSITGNAFVQQGGVWSNSIAFEVLTPLVGSIDPSVGAPGKQVEIYGSFFGATQGTGLVWIGTQYADVVSWSDELIVATVAAGSANGTVQVFQNGVWSEGIDILVTCVEPRAAATEAQSLDQVWADDDFLRNFDGSWREWDTTQSASGTQSFYAFGPTTGMKRTYMFDSFVGKKINPGDTFFLNVLIDECNPTDQLLITLVHTDGSGETRLTWGESDPLEAGPEAIDMGALPEPGQWHRLEIPFQDLGLEGAVLYGIILDNYDGVVWYDYIGKKTTNPPPSQILSITTPSVPPFHIDDEMTFTVTAAGDGPIEYRFRQSIPGTFQYTLLQDWSTDNTLDWTVPYAPESHFWIFVEVRNASSTQTYEDVDFFNVRVE